MITEAKALLNAQEHAVLSTYSKEKEGFPFGSLIPYMLDSRGVITCWVSDLAQHTKNLTAYPKASLTITPADPARDKARLCLMVDVVEVTEGVEALRESYTQRFPLAKQYLSFHDFKPMELQVQSAYYIGGFGRAGWLDWNE